MVGLRLKPLADLWPTPQALVSDLVALGFNAELDDGLPASAGRAIDQEWSKLNAPHGADYPKADATCFCYLGRDGKLPEPSQWGLVVLDEESALLPKKEKFRAIKTNFADAAMDFVLRKLAIKEWSGATHPAPSGVLCEDHVVIGPDCEIGEGTILETGVRLGARVRIGRNCRIGAASRIGDDCVLGDGCTLTSHVSIGGQGFGFVKYPNRTQRRPRLHVGRVVIGESVRIGAHVAIDRGVFEDTVVGSYTSIDNIVQIAHNCRIGASNVICSFVGLSGSTFLGDRVTLAGMVGSKGHVKIGNDVVVAAQSGISRDIRDGESVKGYPPRPIQEALEIQALTAKLPELYERLKKLEGKKA
jgi:UDP-3-O-[3-hydroxymyristoyl] glucosamine N-acyltransferase LpxD